VEELFLSDKKSKTLESLNRAIEAAKQSFPGDSYDYALIDHSTEDTNRNQLSLKREISAAMKEFCNQEVKYRKMDQLALETWLE
jgi:hypothetical protein